MTHDEMIAVTQAHKNHETIEYRRIGGNEWSILGTAPEFDFTHYEYRVYRKSEPHYRPFQSTDEVMEAIKEHGDYVKTTVDGDDYIFPVAFSTNGKRVSFCDILNDAWADSEYVLKNYTFMDGTPFGKLED